MPEYARAWVDELCTQYPHWPADSVKAIVEMYLTHPEMFNPETIQKWKDTQLPEELKNPPREGVITTYPLDSPDHAELERQLNETAQKQTAEIVYTDTKVLTDEQ